MVREWDAFKRVFFLILFFIWTLFINGFNGNDYLM